MMFWANQKETSRHFLMSHLKIRILLLYNTFLVRFEIVVVYTAFNKHALVNCLVVVTRLDVKLLEL